MYYIRKNLPSFLQISSVFNAQVFFRTNQQLKVTYLIQKQFNCYKNIKFSGNDRLLVWGEI